MPRRDAFLASKKSPCPRPSGPNFDPCAQKSEPSNNIDIFSALPVELKIRILKLVDPLTRLKCRILSSTWCNFLMQCSDLWSDLRFVDDNDDPIYSHKGVQYSHTSRAKLAWFLDVAKCSIRSLSFQSGSKDLANSYRDTFWEDFFSIPSLASKNAKNNKYSGFMQDCRFANVIFTIPSLIYSKRLTFPLSAALSNLQVLKFSSSVVDELSLVKFCTMFSPSLKELRLVSCVIEAYPNLDHYSSAADSLSGQNLCVKSWVESSVLDLLTFQVSYCSWKRHASQLNKTMLDSFLFGLFLKSCRNLQEFVLNVKGISINHTRLFTTLAEFPLKSLDLTDTFLYQSDARGISTELLKYLTSSKWQNLVHLLLGSSLKSDLIGLVKARSYRSVDFSYSDADDDLLMCLVRSSPCIEFMAFNGCQKLTSSCLENVIKSLNPLLLKLSLDNCLISATKLMQLLVSHRLNKDVAKFSRLRYISLVNPSSLEAGDLITFCRVFGKQLDHLNLTGLSSSICMPTINLVKELLQPRCRFIYS